MHPIGPHGSGVYWARRVLVAVVALALVGGGLFLVLRPAGGAPGDGEVLAASVPTTTAPMTGVLAPRTGTPTVSTSVRTRTSAPGTPSGGADADNAGGVAGAGAVSSSVPMTTAPAPPTAVTAAVTAAQTPTGATAPTAPTEPDDPTSATAPRDPTTPDAPDASSSKSTPAATASSASATPSTSTSTVPPPPSFDAQGRLICPDDAIEITAFTPSRTFPAGSMPRLGMVVTNVGGKYCSRDVSGTLQVYTVYDADGDRVWSTADCFPGEGHEVLPFAPGNEAPYVIVWSGTTSEPGCQAPRVRVAAGSYTLVAELGELVSEPHSFRMSG